MDYNIKLFAISPRHFEAAICKTLQILVEGDYGNAFQPWKHYVPLKRDFSNIKEVLNFLKNEDQCQKIIDFAYNDIVLNKKYTYESFVVTIIENIRQNANSDSNPNFFYKIAAYFLDFRNDNYWKYEKVKYYIRYSFHKMMTLVRSIIAFVVFDLFKFKKKEIN